MSMCRSFTQSKHAENTSARSARTGQGRRLGALPVLAGKPSSDRMHVGTLLACEAVVSDTCMENRGIFGAGEEAIRRLRVAFHEQVQKSPPPAGKKYHFALVVEPECHPANQKGDPQ